MNMVENKNFAVIGAGYVGISIASLLAQKCNVKILEIDEEKIDKINNREAILQDEEIKKIFELDLRLTATSSIDEAVCDADFVIIALPTNFNNKLEKFDTTLIEEIIPKIIKIKDDISIIIKSTVPVGFTKRQQELNNFQNIHFSPEFLREGSALYDNFYPSRVIIGGEKTSNMENYLEILNSCTKSNDHKTLFMTSSEAESVKLFSNTYLAMRVAFFNELDNFAIDKNLESEKIIKGISLDSRIGDKYNNPSFGYGGYCLPKDTRQLKTDMSQVDHDLISAIIESNEKRKLFIADKILELKPKTIGIYSLAMKSNSDNYRESAIIDVIKILRKNINEILIYEPMIKSEEFLNCRVVSNFELFKNKSELIIANRFTKDLDDVKSKLFTRDIFNTD